MSNESDIDLSDGDIDERKHQQLLDNVLNLSKAQHVKKPSRTEPTPQVSEFNLLKSVSDQRDAVDVNNLTDVLKKHKKHLSITRVVKEKKNKMKTLPAPLPSPQASLIRRTLNYDKSRVGLDRWEGVIMSNRAAPKLYFPLGSVEKLKDVYKEAAKFPSRFRIKSDLQKAMDELEQTVEPTPPTEEQEETKTYLLTLEELKEKRREAAKLRAHQSFKEAKARQRNKIKSKSYHRMLKKERIKQKLKELEELQKTNPEEALKRLDDIEKIRAQERFSLRHKGTGQWAKNKQIRAKYDKETRQQLAEQLAISRDLTRKSKLGLNESDEEINEEEDPLKSKTEEDNPWVSGIKPEKEVSEFLSGYRKYWENNHKVNEESSKEVTGNESQGEKKTKKKVKAKKIVPENNDKLKKNVKSNIQENNHKVNEESSKEVTGDKSKGEKKTKKKMKAKKIVPENNDKLKKNVKSNIETVPSPKLNGIKSQVKDKKKATKVKANQSNSEQNKVNKIDLKSPESANETKTRNQEKLKLKNGQVKENERNPKFKAEKSKSDASKKDKASTIKRKKKKILDGNKMSTSTSDWAITETGADLTIDEMFETLENKLHKKVIKKAKKVKRLEKKTSTTKPMENILKTKKKPDLSIPSRSKKQFIDEEMIEQPVRTDENSPSDELTQLKNVLNAKDKDNTQLTSDINPGSFIKVKTNPLNSAIPDILTTDDNEENVEQRCLITEAFEDDDVIEEFKKEKAKAMEEDNPKDIDLALPGWGSWVGPGIDPKKSRKRKRLVLKFPPAMPRKDANKGSLIINSKAESKVKPLLVSEVPFPFKSVEDYEASIRAPISNTFVPETAYRKMIDPTVKTKMGAIIEPIDKDVLIYKKN